MAKDDVFDPIRQIDAVKLDNLKTLGYTGDVEIEDLMVELNKIKAKEGKESDWWIDFKNNNEKKGISFIDAVYAELISKLKV